MDTYLMKNGKRVELTKEQLELLGIEKNPFDVEDGEKAYYIKADSSIATWNYWDENTTNSFIPCKDKAMVEKRAKQERLSRLLWKYANERGDEPSEEDWKDCIMKKYCIFFTNDDGEYSVRENNNFRYINCQYFKTKEICEQAIDDVIIPFTKGEIN